MKIEKLKFNYRAVFHEKIVESKTVLFIFAILLSWLFAICNQIIIPLPFNFVPISIQPLPLFLLSFLIGWPAVYAYVLTLIQSALGLPFFSGMQGGIVKLLGPTGGYIWGFLVAMVFLVIVRKYKSTSYIATFFKLIFANIIFYSIGLLQLYWFVPSSKLFLLGVYPFLIGCLIKTFLIAFFSVKFHKKC